MKKNNLIVLLVFIFVILVGFWMQYSAKLNGKINYVHFNQANIDSRIKSFEIASKGTKIILQDNSVFIFYPITTNRNIFINIAKINSRVQKKPFSDTLYLYVDNKVYKYNFIKF